MTFFGKLFGRAAKTPSLAREIHVDGHPIALSFATGDRVLAVLTGEGRLATFEIESGAALGNVVGHAGGATALAVDPTSARIATAGVDGAARVFDAASLAVEREAMLDASAWVEHLAWWGSLLVVAHGKRVSLIGSDGSVRPLGTYPSTVAGIDVCGDRLAVARFGGADVVDLARLDATPRHLEWSSSLVSIAWSPDARFLAAGCQDNAIHFWRWPDGTDSMMGGYPGKPKAIAWAPTSEWLATGGASDVVVWSFRGPGPEGTTPLQLRRHERPVQALCFSPDGALLASGARDGLVLVWRADTERPPLFELNLGGTVEAVVFSRNGAWMAAGSSTGRIAVLRR